MLETLALQSKKLCNLKLASEFPLEHCSPITHFALALMTDSKPHILVTGGAGYIGSHTVLALCDAGYSVVIIDDISTGCAAVVPNDVELIIGDAGDQKLISKILRDFAICGVMHFAGSIIVPESVAEPLKYYSNNTGTSQRLIGCCQEFGIRAFVFSSTAAVYGNPKKIPVSEDSVPAPINPYGSSKLMTEQILTDVAAISDIRYAILRYFNVAGADPKKRSGQVGPNSTHLIKIASEVAIGKRMEMSIFGTDYPTPDGTCVRDYIHVSDLASAHVLALRRLFKKEENLLLNCGYGYGYSVREVLQVTERLAGRPLSILKGARRDGDVAELISNSDKIRRILSWNPKYNDLELIIKSALDWEIRKAELEIT